VFESDRLLVTGVRVRVRDILDQARRPGPEFHILDGLDLDGAACRLDFSGRARCRCRRIRRLIGSGDGQIDDVVLVGESSAVRALDPRPTLVNLDAKTQWRRILNKDLIVRDGAGGFFSGATAVSSAATGPMTMGAIVATDNASASDVERSADLGRDFMLFVRLGLTSPPVFEDRNDGIFDLHSLIVSY